MDNHRQTVSADHQQTSNNQNPTTTPRPSFGIELEFLVASLSKDARQVPVADRDPDSSFGKALPPVRETETGEPWESIIQCLVNEGIPVFGTPAAEGQDPLFQKACQNELESWTVKDDGSVSQEDSASYEWRGVEVTSPASYAIEEAFDMIRLVVSLITTNFRCRVNYRAGFHVHIGNGRSRLDLHTARNFGALWWAMEPILTMLHPPERAFGSWCKSTRRTGQTVLASGETAEKLWGRCQPVDWAADIDHNTRARYYGRARKVGEWIEPLRIPDPPEPVSGEDNGDERAKWEDVDDDSDWEAEDGRPFVRPRKERPALKLRRHGSGQKSQEQVILKQGPPEIEIRPRKERTGHAKTLNESQQSGDFQSEDSRGYELEDVKFLQRPRSPPFERRTARTYEPRPADCKTQPDALRRMGYQYEWENPVSDNDRPKRTDFWSGICEILACDIGTHQVGLLFDAENGHSKYANMNWTSYQPYPVSHDLSWGGPGGVPLVLNSKGLADAAGQTKTTIESREAAGTLDAEWIVMWAKILCGLLEFARDASPTEFMRVVGLCATPERYDVVDLLQDVGLYAEARYCEERLQRREEAWFECIYLEDPAQDNPEFSLVANEPWGEACEPATWAGEEQTVEGTDGYEAYDPYKG
jgi:hypothetical protein